MTLFDESADVSSAAGLAGEAVELVKFWLDEAVAVPADPAARRLADLLRDPAGLDFAVGFVDGVVRPEDARVSARALADLAEHAPDFLPPLLRAGVRAGRLAPAMPGIVVPAARRVLRTLVAHLILDSTPRRLGPAIARLRRRGVRLNMNLLGEAVLGHAEATRRLEGTRRLLERSDVDYVSVKVSSTVAPHGVWAFDEAVADIVERLAPLFETAAAAHPAKFINLDMEEYKDLDLTLAAFTRLLDEPRFLQLEAGIVLQAYLPDALDAMMRLQDWSAARRARGGAAIKVRLVKGANLPMERMEASLHGWPLATWGSKRETDTNYKRVLDWALTPERTENVRLGIAGHNLFDIAYSWLLAGQRGVRDAVEYEMLLGMAQAQAEVVQRTVGGLLLYTPVVSPAEFDVAISYLIRRLEEGASRENFMSAVFELRSNPALFNREEERFKSAVAALDGRVPEPHRSSDRFAVIEPPRPGRFTNTPDTDPSVAGNRVWGRAILARAANSEIGRREAGEARITDAHDLDALVQSVREASGEWGRLPAGERAARLHAVGDALETYRAQLCEVMIAETGKTLDQADPEVSEAIDFAHYYAEQALDLESIAGARPAPAAVTVVAPPWNFPVAIPSGGVLAALATGSGVILKPAPLAVRCGALIAHILWEAGIPRSVLEVADIDDEPLGSRLIANPAVDQVILTGAYETAELLRRIRPELPLLAETSGKNAIIVTPSADLDLAVKDVVASAFGHAGQKCSAASLVVLVGTVAGSRRFRSQLVDAVRSLRAGAAWDPATQISRVIQPPAGKLYDGLTRLSAGESWLVEPQCVDEAAGLWSPGLRDGVARGSDFHRIEYFGPILGIMTAADLDEAIDIVNDVEYGLTSGLHSLDPDEIRVWLERIQAGNLYINRGITGAIVRRQPFGGWKRSAVGPGAKAGGPNYLISLTSWAADPELSSTEEPGAAAPVVATLLAAAEAELPKSAARLHRAFADDLHSWSTTFGAIVDVSHLEAERNLFRYLPYPEPVLIRASEGADPADVVRVVGAAAATGAPIKVSIAERLPDRTAQEVAALSREVRVENEPTWLLSAELRHGGRLRLIGATAESIAHISGGRPDLAVYDGPVTNAARLEMLPFLREQAVSITAHRFGSPNHLTDGVLPEGANVISASQSSAADSSRY